MIQTRIGDSERDAAAARLGDNFAQGRLDHEEFNERLDAIWTARTGADLQQLFLDLPPQRPNRTVAQRAPRARRPVAPFPVLVVIAVLLGVVVVKSIPVVLLVAVLWFVVLRPRRRPRTAPGFRVRASGRPFAL